MAVWCEGNPLSMSEVHSTIHWYKRVTTPWPWRKVKVGSNPQSVLVIWSKIQTKFHQNFPYRFSDPKKKWLQHGDSRGPWVKVWLRSILDSHLAKYPALPIRHPWRAQLHVVHDKLKHLERSKGFKQHHTSKRIPESSERKSYTPLKSHEIWRLWARYLLDVSKKM